MAHDLYDDIESSGHSRPPASGDIGPEADIICNGKAETDRLFKVLVMRLRRYYPISRASLTLYDPGAECLRITHIIKEGVCKTGLALSIPGHSSLLHEIFRQGYPLVDNYPDSISGNLIERKILLEPQTRSVAVVPVIHDGTRLGVIGLASDYEAAFSPYLDGYGTETVVEFAASLAGFMTPALASR